VKTEPPRPTFQPSSPMRSTPAPKPTPMPVAVTSTSTTTSSAGTSFDDYVDLDDDWMADIDEAIFIASAKRASAAKAATVNTPNTNSSHPSIRQPQASASPWLEAPAGPRSKWAAETFSWSALMRTQNQDIFGHRGFRTNQLECMNATMAQKHVFLLMPTGTLPLLVPHQLLTRHPCFRWRKELVLSTTCSLLAGHYGCY